MNIDITPFICTDRFRTNLCSAWSVGEFTYATDGRSIVEVPGVIEFDQTLNRPDPATVFGPLADHFAATDFWFPLDEIPNPIIEAKCDACYGTGKEHIDCSECFGEGEIECCECGQDRDCKACSGRGNKQSDSACQECAGKSTVPGYNREVATPCGIIQGYLLARFAALPNAAMYVPPVYKPRDAIAIRFDGGRGVLMPFMVNDQSPVYKLHAAVRATTEPRP